MAAGRRVRGPAAPAAGPLRRTGRGMGTDGTGRRPELPGATRVSLATARLGALLLSPEPVSLRWLAGEVDALGAAAISALAQASSWAVPGTP